jgi:hypothetical protein
VKRLVKIPKKFDAILWHLAMKYQGTWDPTRHRGPDIRIARVPRVSGIDRRRQGAVGDHQVCRKPVGRKSVRLDDPGLATYPRYMAYVLHFFSVGCQDNGLVPVVQGMSAQQPPAGGGEKLQGDIVSHLTNVINKGILYYTSKARGLPTCVIGLRNICVVCAGICSAQPC